VKIGYSVSGCISDIINGLVQESDVLHIVGNTKAATYSDWEDVAKVYRKSSWWENPELGESILWRLVADNKIDQPRCRGEEPPIRQRMQSCPASPYWQDV
jgi:hypothetical protein